MLTLLKISGVCMKTFSMYIQLSLAIALFAQGSFMPHPYQGFLCVLEGIDGSGKTTLTRKLNILLTEQNVAHIITKEPGATKLGAQLRNIILEKTAPTCPLAQFLMFAADRAQHFNEIIVPQLTAGRLVISDRMSDSSLAYQGFFKGLDLAMINTINAWCMQQITADLIIYLRIEAKDALARIKQSREISDKFEQEMMERMDLLVDAFDAIFATRSNVIIIDALQDQEIVAHQIKDIIIATQQAKQHVSN